MKPESLNPSRSIIGIGLVMYMTTAAPGAWAQAKKSPYKPAKQSSQAESGKKLFSKLNCSECHSIGNAGGCLAPPLDGVGGRRTANYMKLRLSNTEESQFIKLMGHPELFPHPRFTPAVVNQLVSYLQTLPQPQGGFKVTAHGAKAANLAEEPLNLQDFKPGTPNADSAEGRRLFFDGGCMVCHSIGGAGADLAPTLNGIGARHTRKYIEAHVNNPQQHLAMQAKNSKIKSKMPQFEFAPNEVSQIAEFLLTLPASK